MRRDWEAKKLSLCFLFHLLLLLARGVDLTSATWCTPEYSHRTGSAKSWLAKRLNNKNVATLTSARWSQLGQVTPFPESKGPPCFHEYASASDEYLRWLHGSLDSSQSQNFSITAVERPGFKSEDSTLVLASFTTRALRRGDTILQMSLDSCLSDAMISDSTKSLQDAPWEVRLASKLLHERAKGSGSRWAFYIKMLPEFVFLPIFFSDLELNNIQDTSVLKEVDGMRRFVEMSFQSLTTKEASGVKFKEYAWAMAIVYSSAQKLSLGASVMHFMIPFVTSSIEPQKNINAVHVGGSIRLEAMEDTPKNNFLSMPHGTSNSSDLLLFHGLVESKQTTVQLFSSLLDLVDWYFPIYGGINNNKYLTLRVAQDADEEFTSQHKLATSSTKQKISSHFLLRSDGDLGPRVVCILAAIFYAKELLASNAEKENVDIANMSNMVGTLWEKKVTAIVKGLIGTNHLDCEIYEGDDETTRAAFTLALEALRKRMQGLMVSMSTTIEEDKSFLAAASWDGFGGTGLSESGCATCRWQLEEMSYNDYLAVLYRLHCKAVLQEAVSQLSCLNSGKLPTVIEAQTMDESTTEQFVSWMKGNGYSISKKLEISHLQAGDGSLVRGVLVLKDIQRGETLCNLPLNMGLYDNETAVAGEVDSWDRAAARILREKAKGNSSMWAPYINALPRKLTVPILLEDHELMEVQWWPVLRELVQVRKSIRESFSLLSAEDLADADFQEYRWAALMVHSRAFTLPVIADEHYAPYVMMPYMDMINHHYHYQADWISQPIWGGKLEIIARRDIQKGEELFASFGPRANDNLFLYYGFVLDGNPFDVAQIFDSYEDAVRWFLNIWTTSCDQVKGDLGTFTSCKRRQWESQWKIVKDALEGVAGRGASLNREWWHLVNLWADLGYQYIPYQPGPTVYSYGVIDPSLVALFESVANNTLLPTLNSSAALQSDINVVSSATESNGNQTSKPLKSFFVCMGDHIKDLYSRALVEGHPCWNRFVDAYSTVEGSTRSLLIGRISASLRCLEVLSLFPTTLEEDQALIKEQDRNVGSHTCSIGGSCSGQQIPSEHLQLTRRYRYLKKLMLQEVVNKLLS